MDGKRPRKPLGMTRWPGAEKLAERAHTSRSNDPLDSRFFGLVLASLHVSSACLHLDRNHWSLAATAPSDIVP
jgi:hypothetical protein